MTTQTLPPLKESDFMKTASLVESKFPGVELLYLDFVETLPSETQEFSSRDERWHFNLENAPALSLRFFSKAASLEKTSVSVFLDRNHENTIRDLHGVSIKDQLVNVLLNEEAHGREKMLYKKYSDLAEISRHSFLSRRQQLVMKWFKKYKPVNYVLSGEDIMRQIIIRANLIATRCRRGQGNFAIVSSETLSLLEDSPSFFYKTTGSFITMGVPIFELVGSFHGIDIFRNCLSKFNDRNIIVGKKTKNDETGVYFATGERHFIEIDDFATLKTKLAIESRVRAVETNNAERCFNVFEIEIGEKPWWKKLFKL